MDEVRKKDQNKSYYERNKERILEKARLRAQGKGSVPSNREGSVVSLFQNSDPVVSKPKSTRKPVARPKQAATSSRGLSIFLMGLVGLMTSFLFHETAKFFFVSDQNWAAALLKAGILEGAAIAFTLMQWRSWLGSVFNGLMVLLIYVFGIWVVSYPVISGAEIQRSLSETHSKSISELEAEIAKKEAIRDQYWKEDRPSYARKYDLSLDDLRGRLNTERQRVVALPVGHLLQGVLLAGIVFRILMMISNFACIRYLRTRKML